MDKKPITPEGQKKLREELDFIKNIKRQEIIDAISEARAHGDLKENAEYHAAREEQGLNEARIRELEDVLSRSQVIEYLELGIEDRVIFGSTVTIKDLNSNETSSYQIVGESEANIEMSTISLTTPIAKALLKREVGDIVEVETPGGTKEVEIIDIKLV
ncbi:MAG: transcription elongation factor GreA [Proteobacteria bacterium]|uniref:Transcription elongation factor GreA n=1 Tax=SAR86 cluster bacterium TaxID=2030880 RepID=A0A937IBI8_9GAMM|nr:transcription elongation factor GreA [SAR86 cluster bacterium]MBL6819703.1 transcription elongation factor GreA [SAR86 cluster bacterium]MDA0345570.1 transcription elongation factor GreA [Pseudomonadota bacterium]MDA0899412.1 transcription elongation factor GreA [Pseudomonadota bacterium]MDA1056807.1 transcription elongation factor GreA [Pseudomonadota bacterium]